MNSEDPSYLIKLVAYMKATTPNAILDAERAVLKQEIAEIEALREQRILLIRDEYETHLVERRNRLAEIEGKIAGEQMGLFRVGPITDKIEIKCGTDFDATNGPVKDSAFNAAMNYAAKYPASQKPIGMVIPCSNEAIEQGKARLEAKLLEPIESLDFLNEYNTPKNAQVVTRDGQTFFVFKSAGYKAIAERLGFPYRSMGDGMKRYLLTPKEYDAVFTEHQKAVKYRKEMKDFKL